MPSEDRSSIIRASVLYVVFTAIMGLLSFATPYKVQDFGTLLPYIPTNLKDADVGVLLIPIIVGVTLFYLGVMINYFFEGRLTQVLVFGLYAAAFVSVFAVYMILQPLSAATQYAGFLVFGAYAAYFTYTMLSMMAEIRGQHYLRVVSGSALTFVLGQICIQLVNVYMTDPSVPVPSEVALIRDMLRWGFAAASVVTLFGIFRESRNAYLVQVGGIASNTFLVMAVSLIGTLYIYFLNGRLISVAPVIAPLAKYVEWTGVVILGALIFTIMRRGMSESLMAPGELGSWVKHIQDISPTKGKALENFTVIIDEFITDGRKDRLLVKLFIFLDENRASETEVTQTLGEIINYESEQYPSFSKRGVSDRIERMNQKNRMEILQRTLNKINSLGLGGLVAKSQSSEAEQTIGMEN